MSTQRIQTVYRVSGSQREAHAIARAIAYEQTVELPEDLITDARILGDVVGTVEAVEPDTDLAGALRITIGYANGAPHPAADA
jgi:hypothetical protein